MGAILRDDARRRREQAEHDHGYAYVIFDRLLQQIRDYEATLQPDEEIAAYLSSFGARVLIQIDKISYQDPHLIIFHGTTVEDHKRVQLVQHTSQLNVLFTAVTLKPEEHRPARRIGFHTEPDDKSNQSA